MSTPTRLRVLDKLFLHIDDHAHFEPINTYEWVENPNASQLQHAITKKKEELQELQDQLNAIKTQGNRHTRRTRLAILRREG